MRTLSRLKNSKSINEDFYVLDIETTMFKKGERVEFIFGVLYGYEFCKVFYNRDELKEELLKHSLKGKKVFAHNAEFDLNVLYDNIYKFDKKAIFNGKFISATNGNVIFCDSLNILLTSAKKIGSYIGLEKLDLSKDFKNKGTVSKEDVLYCIRDCEIIYKALLSFFKEMGGVRITISGLSLLFFRSSFLKFNIDYNPDLCEYFFKSYFGGRCEVFEFGKTKAFVYDVNSMYPFVMRDLVLPNPKFLKISDNSDLNNFLLILNKFEGVVKCTVEHKITDIGHLPFKIDNKLCFPGGVFNGWFNFNELRYSIENDVVKILKVDEFIYSSRLTGLFTEFVDFCYNKREEGGEYISYIFKLISNCLYGKFAQKIDEEKIYIEDLSKEYDIIEKLRKDNIKFKIDLFNDERNDCFIIVNKEDDITYNTIPLISSYITSAARIELLKIMKKYYNLGLIYTDTDSLFLKKEINLKNSKKLGCLKKENKIITCINGLKNYDYICDNIKIKKIKGVPKSAKKIKDKYIYYSLTKTKESLVRNIKTNIYLKRTKIIKNVYTKRIITDDLKTKILVI